ncbi:MAG: DUF6165 family protein [Gemmatimonadota bacterium]|uniref:DUF6165 family protein n=1 Tax=Candidatus Palauibacter scopulicola TaxID=3056741 RepID=UPI0023A20EA5|nr:DUF6165 family protein [Candidatus Palauibacter scopulicola]MDE2662430.1 DUF6165 family protein [Candidatus Palauibacter scopulicola]
MSAGELIDRITILRLKQARIRDRRKLANVNSELANVEAVCARTIGALDAAPRRVRERVAALAEVNRGIWDVEDELRRLERADDFGPRFTEAARQVYRLNDERHRLKRALSEDYGSGIVEEKSHTSADPEIAPA